MSLKTFATLALATGFAVAKPISNVQSQPGFTKRQGFGGDGFNFIDGFNNFNKQEQVIQIQENNLQIVDNGQQQLIVAQAQEVLIVDQQQNGFNNDLNNLFRKSSSRNNFKDVSTVMLVVQEIQIAIDDGRGNQVQQNIFAQSAVVANRGRDETRTVMVFDSRTLIAQDILGKGGVGGAPIAAELPTKTAGVQLLGAKPTWSEVAEDPAATLGGVWQAEIEDLQAIDNNQADADANNKAAEQEKAALEEALKAIEGQEGQDQQGQDEAAQQAEEQKAAEEEAKKAEEEAQKAAEEQQKQQDEQAKAAEEEVKKAEEQAKQQAEGEAKAAEEQAKQQAEGEAKAAEEQAKQQAEAEAKAQR